MQYITPAEASVQQFYTDLLSFLLESFFWIYSEKYTFATNTFPPNTVHTHTVHTAIFYYCYGGSSVLDRVAVSH